MSGADLDALAFTPTRDAGLKRLHAFAPRAGRWYANHGGVDHGPGRRANTAGLAPWLSSRLLTPEEAIAAVEAEHGPPAAVVLREEVEAPLRRRAWLGERPEVWRAHRLRVEQLFRTMAKSASLLSAYEQTVEGRTGLDAADGWARELAGVGWLHPAALRAFASLWIFSLRLPWELGADLHLRSALDGDAAGLLLWREVAGLRRGTPPYFVQVDEIAALSGGRFRPKRRLVEEQAVALSPSLPSSAGEGARSAGLVVDQPVPDPSLRTGWLLTEADLSAAAPAVPVVAVAALGTAPHRSPFDATGPLAAWLDGALADALARAAEGRPAERLDDADWGRSLRAWAAAHDLQQIITAPPPPGPPADRLAAAARRLGEVKLVLAV